MSARARPSPQVRSPWLRVVGACALLGACAAPSRAEPQDAVSWPAPGASWRSLHLEARKAIFRGSVDLRAERRPAADVAADLRSCPDGDARKPDGEVVVFSLVTDASFRSRASRTTWADASGLLQDDGREGKRQSTRRFAPAAFCQWRQKGKSPWEERRVAFERLPGRPLVDVGSMLWLATGLRLDREGARLDVAVVSKGRVLPLRLEAKETATIERGHGDRVETRRVLIASEDEHDASLFGLKGDVDLYLSLADGMPVELRGHVEKLGAVRVRVRAVEAEAPAPGAGGNPGPGGGAG